MPQRKLLKPGEVASLFRVDPKTVGRWALGRRIGSLKTPGGHRRYDADEVEALIKSSFTSSLAAERLAQLKQMIGGQS